MLRMSSSVPMWFKPRAGFEDPGKGPLDWAKRLLNGPDTGRIVDEKEDPDVAPGSLGFGDGEFVA
jgi:hypothetical protein